jgi:hypothetical protein
MTDILQRAWALFTSDPVTFITIFAIVVAGVAGFVWRFRGHIDKERLDARDERLQLASEKEKVLSEKLETAKRENQQLTERLSQQPGQFIPVGQLDIKDLARGTASAIDQALIANSELRSTLTPDRSEQDRLVAWLKRSYSLMNTHTTWQDRISGCFGHQDGRFAVHPLDEKRAKELIKEAKASGASRDDFEKEIERYLIVHATVKDGVRARLRYEAKETLNELWGETSRPT